MGSARKFGRYTLLRRLAKGGMAEIHLALLHGAAGFAKTVVIKQILAHLGDDPQFVAMFIDEAVLAAQFAHPNVVSVLDFGNVDGQFFIAMDHIDGVDLAGLLAQCARHRCPLRAAEVCALGEGIAHGLAYAHGLCDPQGTPRGIVHRDVSPQNVMLSRAGDVKVMDFGIAKAASRLSQTAAGTLKGKLAYMAPEQAAGKEATARSDQFSLGVILYEMLSGKRPFGLDAKNDMALLWALTHDAPRPLVEACAAAGHPVDPVLAAIVMRSVAADPAERYPDVQALEHALTAYRFGLGSAGLVDLGGLVDALRGADAQALPGGDRPAVDPEGATRPLRPAARPRHRRRRRLAQLALGLACAAGAALGALPQSLPPAPRAAAAPAAFDPGHAGSLTLQAEDPMQVYLGKALLGRTPLAQKPVPAGRLKLRLVRGHTSRPYEVFVPAGGAAWGLIRRR